MSQIILLIMLLAGWMSPKYASLQSEEAVVRAVLFYSTTCGHCQYVITEVLPPLFEKYGDRLQIIGINIGEAGGYDMFTATLQQYNQESGGVPALIVGEYYLVGSVDIPEKFPGIIEEYLAQGGVDWPDIPGLAQALSSAQTSQAATASPVSEQSSPNTTPIASPEDGTRVSPPLVPITPTPTDVNIVLSSQSDTAVWERVALDPWGNSLAIIVLAGMIVSLITVLQYIARYPGRMQGNTPIWLIPLLCAVGLGVAGYLAYIEMTQVLAYCGPVGDCNTVQQSQYARLFGILPIGVLGLVGYILMGITWAISHFGNERTANLASLALFLMSLLGVLFSIYLTFLEPFVIGATCAWCLTSAILMTVLMWLTARRGIQAWTRLQGKAMPRRAA